VLGNFAVPPCCFCHALSSFKSKPKHVVNASVFPRQLPVIQIQRMLTLALIRASGRRSGSLDIQLRMSCVCYRGVVSG
jgi:hypothetical protein